VHDPRDLLDRRVEEPEGVGVGQHQARNVLVGLGAQVVEVHPALGVRADLHDLVAGHRHGRGVRAVGGVGREDLVASVAAVLVVGAREQHAGELAMRACRRLQRDVWQASDLAQRLLQVPHQLQRALGATGVLEGVEPRVAGQSRDPLVQPRVVLHRARAEGVEAGVEVEVAPRQPHVVADQLGLGDLGEARRVGAQRPARQQLRDRAVGDVELGGDEGPPPRLTALEDGHHRLALHRRRRRGPPAVVGMP
jgi:hypothetical protein